MNEPPVIAVVGPTAAGKSELGLALALRLGGEIINCDSVQVYQGIEIATAKVPLAERRGVPHHLMDFVPPEQTFTAMEWATAATQKIRDIEARGRGALLVGGTGFYLRALREPFFESPPTDASLRRRLISIREKRGPEHLHRMLRRVDAASAARLFPRDWSRVTRALEVRFQTGKPLSAQEQARPAPPECAARLRIFALNPPRAALYERINRRAAAHFAAGLVEEVRDLLARGAPPDAPALGAHGYRRVVEYLRGERTLESALEQTQLDVRHYAKRQFTWFRREAGVTWIDGFGETEAALEAVLNHLERIRPAVNGER
jgi:tRNA dimethylallyltransferase